ncbi:QueT transporter family protein [Leuconostocaceae bacterium ESL0958]|nr:QueT transporter family protein [Leuconostocaceae bacterium ESL0958]
MQNEKKVSRTQSITMTAVVAAVYAAITMVIAPIGFGPVQLRLSEGLNHLAAWHKRYIVALGLGVLIANLLSPLGWIDWVFGTLGTVVMTSLTYCLTRRVKATWLKLIISSLSVLTVGMGILAAEFTLAFQINASGAFPPDQGHTLLAQWWAYYLSVLPGEAVSLLVGALLIAALSKVMDLSK